MSCCGDRNKRVRLSLHLRFAPLLHAAISTLVGIVMLINSPYDFIERYGQCVKLYSFFFLIIFHFITNPLTYFILNVFIFQQVFLLCFAVVSKLWIV